MQKRQLKNYIPKECGKAKQVLQIATCNLQEAHTKGPILIEVKENLNSSLCI
jgi:hypothetical protein